MLNINTDLGLIFLVWADTKLVVKYLPVQSGAPVLMFSHLRLGSRAQCLPKYRVTVTVHFYKDQTKVAD